MHVQGQSVHCTCTCKRYHADLRLCKYTCSMSVWLKLVKKMQHLFETPPQLKSWWWEWVMVVWEIVVVGDECVGCTVGDCGVGIVVGYNDYLMGFN